MTQGAIFISHLSDLHLGEHALDTGSRERKRWWWFFLRKKALPMQAHDPYIFAALHTEMEMAARDLEAPDGKFDLNLFTGDISTSASSSKRFSFARKFITSMLPLPGSVIALRAGLNLPPEDVFCVPGNHDKLFQTTNERYLAEFSGLPKAPPYRVTKITRCGREVTVFGIDSNDYLEGNIARGTVSPATAAWLRLSLGDGKRSDQALRVLILHHHPCDLNKFRARTIKGVLEKGFTTMDQGERLLQLCSGKVDVILHGHEHFPVAFRDSASNCIVVSAGTAMEWQAPESKAKNSFHALKIVGNDLRIYRYDWTGARFALKAREHFLLGT